MMLNILTTAFLSFICICFFFLFVTFSKEADVLHYVFLGDKRTLGLLLCVFFGLSLALVSSGIVPAFTEDVARSVNVSTFLCYCSAVVPLSQLI
jgi:uncharacterized membrane protein YraQ (UPF0718 family)